ncbi:MAG: transposase [Gimesia sp.]
MKAKLKQRNVKKKRVHRTFSDEFKRDAVNLVVVEGYTFSAAAKAVNVSPKSLREWYNKFAPEPEACGDKASVGQLMAENKRLRKQLKQAEMEREILKEVASGSLGEGEAHVILC